MDGLTACNGFHPLRNEPFGVRIIFCDSTRQAISCWHESLDRYRLEPGIEEYLSLCFNGPLVPLEEGIGRGQAAGRGPLLA